MKYSLKVNGEVREVDVEADTPLLWVIREELGLTGTKYSCGIAAFGACTVHIDGEAQRICVLSMRSVATEAEITTIEGLSDDRSHPVQQAWLEIDVPQCGYCQSGQIMAAAALLEEFPEPDDETIKAVMTNLCRCGTYPRILKAIKRAAEIKAEAI